MTKKYIVFQAHVKKSKPKQPVETSWSVFTDDYQSIKLSFVISDMFPSQLEGAIPSLILTMEDGSVVQINHEKIELKENVFSYTLSETEGKHSGVVETQLRFTIHNRQLVTDRFTFQILESLFDVNIPSEFVLDDIRNILLEVTHHINNIFEDEPKRAEVFADFMNQLDVAEKQRQQLFEQAHSLRAITFRQLEDEVNSVKDTYDELVDTGILESNISAKLTDLEESYAPRLSTLEQNDVTLTAQLQQTEQDLSSQLAQTDFVSQTSNLIGGYEKMYYKRENSLGWITVMLKKGEEHVSWVFRNNTYDDFIILGDCFYGDITNSMRVYQNKNYDSISGSWVTTAPNSHYTTEVGATFTTIVTGENIDFYHYADNRGGIWEFVIDDDVENPITVSTWNTTVVSTKKVILAENLTLKEHKIVGTFKGADPLHPPSSGSARGWVWVNGGGTIYTFRTYKTQLTNTRTQDLLVGFSNKEFAIRTRKAGSSQDYHFIPMHGSVGTAFKKEEPFFIADGKTVDHENLVTNEFIECNNFNLVQSVYGRNPESGNENLVLINTNVSINKSGDVEITGKIKPMTDIEIQNGYGLMFPVNKAISTRAISSKGSEYATVKTDYSSTFMPNEGDTTVSFAFVSEENPDFIATIRFNDTNNTLRTNEAKNSTPFWIEHRDATLQKLYYRAFENRTLTTSDVFKFSGTLNCGKVKKINNLL